MSGSRYNMDRSVARKRRNRNPYTGAGLIDLLVKVLTDVDNVKSFDEMLGLIVKNKPTKRVGVISLTTGGDFMTGPWTCAQFAVDILLHAAIEGNEDAMDLTEATEQMAKISAEARTKLLEDTARLVRASLSDGNNKYVRLLVEKRLEQLVELTLDELEDDISKDMVAEMDKIYKPLLEATVKRIAEEHFDKLRRKVAP